MKRISREVSAVERARWLAELASAVEQAQKLAWRLGISEGDNPEAKDLYGRLETIRAEVQSLQLAGFGRARAETEPNWINPLLWEREALPGGI